MAPLVSLLFLAATTRLTLATPNTLSNRQTGKIQWKACEANLTASVPTPLEIQCGSLRVPLDYTAANCSETLELSLARVPAVNGPAEHSILFNFGGPGEEGRFSLAKLSDTLMASTGGTHDLITWDPRGTAQTLTFSCFDTLEERNAIGMTLTNSSDVGFGQAWARGKNYADACAEYPEAMKRGPLINTPFTARDAMRIVDAVESDGLVRYWGLSYGTVLGVTIAAMFPDRAEKILIDGVANPFDYYHSFVDFNIFSEADATFTEFFRQCVSNSSYCSLARTLPNATAADLESKTWAYLDEIKFRPLPYKRQIVDYSMLKNAIRFALYAPETWVTLADILSDFLAPQPDYGKGAGELVALTKQVSKIVPKDDDSAFGIQCIDKMPRTDSFEVFEEFQTESQAVSRVTGETLGVLYAGCAQWGLKSREPFTKSIADVRPHKPLFVIGNKFDSATSFRDAVNISSSIEGSVLLEHGGYGHASVSQPSICTARHIQNFFVNGTLPEAHTYCPPVAPPFQYAVDGPSWAEVYPAIGFDIFSKGDNTS